jgi:2-polyprenyl-3-methyl-5-hydroxy-6-metoxy-1,4-benzoquinol methylase
MTSDSPRYVEWTPELVARFWNNCASSQVISDQYFTFQVGREIVAFLRDVIELNTAAVLDYGAGPGFLVERLLEAGAQVTAADYSSESVSRTKQRFADRKGFFDAVQIFDGAIAAPDACFDLITCIETIEHMFEESRQKLLFEFHRVLKPGGRLLLTTPNNEDLQKSMIFCPQCAQQFHSMQHICTWTGSSLASFLLDNGFTVNFCEGVDLRRWGPPPIKAVIDYSSRDLFRAVRDSVLGGWAGVADAISPRPFPNSRAFRQRLATYQPVHLVAVATRR